MINNIIRVLGIIGEYLLGRWKKKNSPDEILRKRQNEADKAIATGDVTSINQQLESSLRRKNSDDDNSSR